MGVLTSRRRFIGAGSLFVLGAAAGCAGSDDDAGTTPSTSPAPSAEPPSTVAPEPTTTAPAAEYVPTAGTWETVDPASVGWSQDAIDELASFLEVNNSRTFALVIGGRIAAESYWAGAAVDTPQEIASCQKSVVSTLCGIAVDRGLLTVDDPVSDYLDPGWSAADPADERAITIRHLLSMTSGLNQDTLEVVAAPGTAWGYNTTAYQKLRPVLEAASGEGIDSLNRSWLWEPIGVSGASRWRERTGNGALALDATGSRLWSLEMTARDMARFGLLVQRRGTWGSEQVVATEWFDEALAPSQTMNPSYGYLWWLAGAIDQPDVPDDLVAALGALDQKIYVVPSFDCVLVRQGGRANEVSGTASSFDPEILDRLVSAQAG